MSRRTPSERVSPLRAAHASRRAVTSADSRKAIKGVFPVGFRPGFPFFSLTLMKVLYIFENCEASGPLRRRHISSELSSTIAQVEQDRDRDRDSHFDKDDRHLDNDFHEICSERIDSIAALLALTQTTLPSFTAMKNLNVRRCGHGGQSRRLAISREVGTLAAGPGYHKQRSRCTSC